MLMAKLATLKREDNIKQNKNTEGSIGPSGITNEQAAELGNVGLSSIKRAKKVIASDGGSPLFQQELPRRR